MAAAILGYGIFATEEYDRLGGPVSGVDLGIFYQAVQGWAFHADPYVAIKGFSQLGDHFTPAWALLAPLLWIHNSPYMLVAAEVVLISLSGVPVYIAVRRMCGTWRAAGVTAAYLASSGLQHAIAFPVHEVMFAVPIARLRPPGADARRALGRATRAPHVQPVPGQRGPQPDDGGVRHPRPHAPQVAARGVPGDLGRGPLSHYDQNSYT